MILRNHWCILMELVFFLAQIMVLHVWFRHIEYMGTRLLKLTRYTLKSL